ncbi:MAG: ABC transporter permease [Acidobacteria bacterium]|nr:ABC transporter permease [Acidobacteriota bacterium]
MMSKFWRRLQFWWHRDQMEAELREEMETHRRLREAALREADHPSPTSRSTRVMGNTTLAVEDARAVWLWPWLESLWLDLKHGARGLRRQPTLTITALLTIAVGSGALTTAFAVAHTVLLKAPPYTNADRLVQILQVQDGRRRSQVASVDVDVLRSASTLEGVAFAALNSVSLTGAELPENARAVLTDHHLFPVLGTVPALGRWPTQEDDNGSVRPVVLSHHLWQRRY